MFEVENNPLSEHKKNLLNKLEALSYDDVSIDEVFHVLNSLLQGFEIGGVSTDNFLRVYRGIKYVSKPMCFSEIIYPPKEKAKINRASNEGESMFYCSTSKKAVFYELNAQVGDKFVLSTWNNNENFLFLNNIGYTKQNLALLGAMDIDRTFIKPLSSQTSENLFLDEYLSRKFSQPITKNYMFKLTNAIAKFYRSDLDSKQKANFHNFDGLVYPTIKFNANADNIAFLPAIIDSQKLAFERTEFVEICNYIDGQYHYKIVDVANSIDKGNINWENLVNTWTVKDESEDVLFVDGIAYNQEGDIILPD